MILLLLLLLQLTATTSATAIADTTITAAIDAATAVATATTNATHLTNPTTATQNSYQLSIPEENVTACYICAVIDFSSVVLMRYTSTQIKKKKIYLFCFSRNANNYATFLFQNHSPKIADSIGHGILGSNEIFRMLIALEKKFKFTL